MMIMGLDIARNVGWSFGDSRGKPSCGVFKLPGFDDVNRWRSMASLYTAVLAMVKANGIEGVVIEAPLMGVSRKNKRGITTPTSAHGTRVLTMASGAAQAGAFNGGAKKIWMPEVSTWRKQVLGNGFPADPKVSAISYCRIAFKMDVPEHDAAEAVCLWSWGCGQSVLI